MAKLNTIELTLCLIIPPVSLLHNRALEMGAGLVGSVEISVMSCTPLVPLVGEWAYRVEDTPSVLSGVTVLPRVDTYEVQKSQ